MIVMNGFGTGAHKSNQIKSNFICTAHFIQGSNTMRLTVGKKRGGVTLV